MLSRSDIISNDMLWRYESAASGKKGGASRAHPRTCAPANNARRCCSAAASSRKRFSASASRLRSQRWRNIALLALARSLARLYNHLAWRFAWVAMAQQHHGENMASRNSAQQPAKRNSQLQWHGSGINSCNPAAK